MTRTPTLTYLIAILLFASYGCDDETPGTTINSDTFAVCNTMLNACVVGDGDYCLFGFKWGEGNAFEATGYNANGPQLTGGVVTYSFQEENGEVYTHSDVGLESQSFDKLAPCARSEFERAFEMWASVADISFEQLEDNSNSDIRIFTTNSRQRGIGYPNYTETPCDMIGGDIIIQTGVFVDDCDAFFLLSLHEIGHAIGLGHVNNTVNVMSTDVLSFDLDTLRAGDIAGARALYGPR